MYLLCMGKHASIKCSIKRMHKLCLFNWPTLKLVQNIRSPGAYIIYDDRAGVLIGSYQRWRNFVIKCTEYIYGNMGNMGKMVDTMGHQMVANKK